MKKVISLFCAVAMILTMAGCGGEKGPDAVVSKFCKALKEMDNEAMAACMVKEEGDDAAFSSDDMPSVIYDTMRENAGKITYTIGEVTADESNGTVVVNFTYQDISAAVTIAVGEFVPQAMAMALTGADEAALSELFTNILTEKLSSVPATEKEAAVEFSCVMTTDGWKIEDGDDLIMDIISNDILNALNKLESIFGD